VAAPLPRRLLSAVPAESNFWYGLIGQVIASSFPSGCSGGFPTAMAHSRSIRGGCSVRDHFPARRGLRWPPRRARWQNANPLPGSMVAMLRAAPLFLFVLGACGFQPAQQPGSSVTVTLPPPRAVPSPGFSGALTGPTR